MAKFKLSWQSEKLDLFLWLLGSFSKTRASEVSIVLPIILKLTKKPVYGTVFESAMKWMLQKLTCGLTWCGVCDRPFITELSVSVKLSSLLWQQHYSSGLGLAKQRPLSCSHLLPRIDRCSLHYQHRGYLHDTGTLRMLMMLLSATGMLVSWAWEGERKREQNSGEKKR